jgi:toxin-antitoxin system PIN domain toxin
MDGTVPRLTSLKMTSFDTNIAVYAANGASPWHEAAKQFLRSLALRKDVAVCELVLVELYLKLRNEKIFPRPLTAQQAAAVCQTYRKNRAWTLIEAAPIMEEVWTQAAEPGFAFRRIIDLRFAHTLRHHGVTDFATSNEKDFVGQGFARVWNPLLL